MKRISVLIASTLFLIACGGSNPAGELSKMQDQLAKLKKQKSELEKQIDSLENEIYVLELKLFRHERAYEIFEEKHPEASSQLSDIISDETE